MASSIKTSVISVLLIIIVLAAAATWYVLVAITIVLTCITIAKAYTTVDEFISEPTL